jgi:hypothetical protein
MIDPVIDNRADHGAIEADTGPVISASTAEIPTVEGTWRRLDTLAVEVAELTGVLTERTTVLAAELDWLRAELRTALGQADEVRRLAELARVQRVEIRGLRAMVDELRAGPSRRTADGAWVAVPVAVWESLELPPTDTGAWRASRAVLEELERLNTPTDTPPEPAEQRGADDDPPS